MKRINHLITCPGHLNLLVDPVVLHCTHAYCKRCLIILLKANIKKCIVCYKPINFSIEEVRQTPVSDIHNHLIATASDHTEPKERAKMILKISFVGFSSAGKTSLIRSIKGMPFVEGLPATLGVDLCDIYLDIHNYNLHLQLWDTAGSEIYRSITRTHYRGSHGIILVYDVTMRESFISLDSWLKEIRQNCGRDDDALVLMIGNKIDLKDKRCITEIEGQQFADANNLMYCETSAKTGENVKESFERLVTKIIHATNLSNSNSSIHILKEIYPLTKKKCCK